MEGQRRHVGERTLQSHDGIFGVVGQSLDRSDLCGGVGQAIDDRVECPTGHLTCLPHPAVDEPDAIELITQIDQCADSAGERAAETLEPRRVPVVDSPDVNHAVKVPASCPPNRVLRSP